TNEDIHGALPSRSEPQKQTFMRWLGSVSRTGQALSWLVLLRGPFRFPGAAENTHRVCPEFLNPVQMGRRIVRRPPSDGLDGDFTILEWLRTDSTHHCITLAHFGCLC